jgi:hypothetical protein
VIEVDAGCWLLVPPDPEAWAVVAVELEGDGCAPELDAVAVCRVVIAVRTLVELHALPCGCALRIWLIVESIFDPAPMCPGG